MRYIDADKLQLYLNDYAIQVSPSENDDEKTRKWNEIVYMTIDTCMKAVDEQPTADVVEVVWCKDCKHRKKNTFCLHNMRYEDDNGFCSYGEMAEE